MRPLLTIAIPTYNGSRTINRMLDILLPQVDEKVEVLVLDNCSTDNTPEIVKSYQMAYPFIRYERNEANIGADGNFLSCMKRATGKYIHLLSDDDVLVEGALKQILAFLESSPDMGLVYLGTANFYSSYTGRENCTMPIKLADKMFCTKSKKIFMEYAKHYWGFVSSFIILKDKFDRINNAEEYFGTYWLQSYIHILCSDGDNTDLGIVGGLCIGAGVYITQSNYDTAFVDGISYREMLRFAVKHGYDQCQLDSLYINRICLLASHGIVKEKATGQTKINKKLLFECTKNYPKAWVRIYPFMLVPKSVCRLYMKLYRRKKGVTYDTELNRSGDAPTDKSDLR